jgi:hypothetical protein
MLEPTDESVGLAAVGGFEMALGLWAHQRHAHARRLPLSARDAEGGE